MKRQIAFIAVFSFGVCMAGTDDQVKSRQSSKNGLAQQVKDSLGGRSRDMWQWQLDLQQDRLRPAKNLSDVERLAPIKNLRDAILCEHYEEALQFVSAKNVNEQDNLGMTPLMWLVSDWWIASKTKKEAIKQLIEKLLSHGADCSIKDNSGRTVFDIVQQDKVFDLLNILQNTIPEVEEQKQILADNVLQANKDDEQKQPATNFCDQDYPLRNFADKNIEQMKQIAVPFQPQSISHVIKSMNVLNDQKLFDLITLISRSFDLSDKEQQDLVLSLLKQAIEKCEKDIIPGQLLKYLSQMPNSYLSNFIENVRIECSICLKLQDEKLFQELGPCRHYLHQECRKQWNKNCPLCRTEIK